jgi:hypothetical protein
VWKKSLNNKENPSGSLSMTEFNFPKIEGGLTGLYVRIELKG